jgi:hypothetical protein
MVRWNSRNLSELNGLSVGYTVGPFVDRNNALVFAVCPQHFVKIGYSTSRNHMPEFSKFPSWMIFKSVYLLVRVVFLPIQGVKCVGMSSNIHSMP